MEVFGPARFIKIWASFGGSMPIFASRHGLLKSRFEYESMFWIVTVLPIAKPFSWRIMFMSIPFSITRDLNIVDGGVFLKFLLMKRAFSPKDFRIFLEKFNNSLILICLGFLKFRMLMANGTFPLWLRKSFSRIFWMGPLMSLPRSKISIILMVPPRRSCMALGSGKSSLKIAVSLFFSTKFSSPRNDISSEKHKWRFLPNSKAYKFIRTCYTNYVKYQWTNGFRFSP